MKANFHTRITWSQYSPNSKIKVGRCNTPWGIGLLGMIEAYICSLTFIKEEIAQQKMSYTLPRTLKGIEHASDDRELRSHWETILEYWQTGISDQLPYTLVFFGTPFQQAVWKGLLALPRGSTLSYEALAANIGYPKAIRATATAVGQNPISLLNPCHRIIPKGGGVGKYAWGSQVKQQLLQEEGILI
jgi:O-6-methylguanine DNA methyltransferase